MGEELNAKGIITSSFPQGEYGKRLTVITDCFGKITAFANGAGKTSSKIIGAVRPLCCSTFSLAKGRSAWNVHSVEVIDSFSELTENFDIYAYSMYILETGEYFAQEGMPEFEAKALLNLMFVALSALKKTGSSERLSQFTDNLVREALIKKTAELIRRVYELRLLVFAGEYTEEPYFTEHQETLKIWTYVLNAPLSALFGPFFELAENEKQEDILQEFSASVRKLFDAQVQHTFNSLKIIR